MNLAVTHKLDTCFMFAAKHTLCISSKRGFLGFFNSISAYDSVLDIFIRWLKRYSVTGP